MDATRAGDLKKLHRAFNDPLLPVGQRRRAFSSYVKIRKQIRDPKLNALRRRLARSMVAGNSKTAEKITEQLTDYSIKEGY